MRPRVGSWKLEVINSAPLPCLPYPPHFPTLLGGKTPVGTSIANPVGHKDCKPRWAQALQTPLGTRIANPAGRKHCKPRWAQGLQTPLGTRIANPFGRKDCKPLWAQGLQTPLGASIAPLPPHSPFPNLSYYLVRYRFLLGKTDD